MLQFFQGAQLNSADTKYSVYDFYYRMMKLEKICAKEGLDGLLIITGIDSRENSEYTKLVNWLILGHSGLEVESNEFLDAMLGDIIILIKPNGVSLFSDRQGWDAMKSKILILPNTDIFVPNPDEDENKDESELLKICQFYKMMTDVKKVAVLLGKKDEGKLNRIEKWPLIQSYGIQELGRGFFSMAHQVVDLTARINQLYKVHDKHSIKSLVSLIAPRLNGHIQAAVGQISDLKMKKRGQITEEQICEVFIDTFEIEEMNKFIKPRQSLTQIPNFPRILMGKNTNASFDVRSSASSIQSLSQENLPPLHLTVESFDLFTSLRCARTYFLTKGIPTDYKVDIVMNEENFIESYNFRKEEITFYQDEYILSSIYRSIVIAFYEAMNSIAKDYRNLTDVFISNIVFEKLKLLNNPQLTLNNLKVNVCSYNALGEEVPINFKDSISFKLTPNFFMIRIQYLNVQSQTLQGQLIGSVLFAESFILQENCYVLLTKQVPYINVFNTFDLENSDTIEQLKKRLIVPSIGKQISDICDKNRIFIPTGQLTNYRLDIPLFNATLVLHEKALRVGSDNLGWFIILIETLQNIELVMGSQLNHYWLIFQHPSGVVLGSLESKTVAIEFTGKAIDQILFPLKKLLDENNIEYRQIQAVPNVFVNSYLGQTLLKQPLPYRPIINNQVMDSYFLLDYLESKQLTILNQMKDLKISNYRLATEQVTTQAQDIRTGLIFITGGPSSGKNRFVSSLLRYASDFKCEATAMTFGLLEQAALNETGFIQKLETTLTEFLRSQEKKQIDKVCLCVVPYFLNLDDIIAKIEGGQLSKVAYIRSIINKINANYFYVGQHSQILNTIVPLSLPGYCQAVVLDSFGNYESDLDDLLKVIRAILPGQQVFRITNNIVYQPIAEAIFKERGYQNNANILMRTKLGTLRQLPPISTVRLFVPWRVPLRKDKARKLLRNTLQPKIKSDLKQNNKQTEEYELLRLLEKINNFKKERTQISPKLTYFKGIVRYEEVLKDGLIEITGNENYVTERDVKNVKVNLKEIHVNGKVFQDAEYFGWTQEEDMGFLFLGSNINREYCEQVLLECCRDAPPLKQTIDRKDLDEATIKKLEFDNRGHGLEHGQFYDGCHFRDEDGMVMPHHPKLDQLIQQYLDLENQKIKEENKQIRYEWEQFIKAYQ